MRVCAAGGSNVTAGRACVIVGAAGHERECGGDGGRDGGRGQEGGGRGGGGYGRGEAAGDEDTSPDIDGREDGDQARQRWVEGIHACITWTIVSIMVS